MMSCRVASGRLTGKVVRCCPAHWTTSWSSHTHLSGQPVEITGDEGTAFARRSRTRSRRGCALGCGARRMTPPRASSTLFGQSRSQWHSSLIHHHRASRLSQETISAEVKPKRARGNLSRVMSQFILSVGSGSDAHPLCWTWRSAALVLFRISWIYWVYSADSCSHVVKKPTSFDASLLLAVSCSVTCLPSSRFPKLNPNKGGALKGRGGLRSDLTLGSEMERGEWKGLGSGGNVRLTLNIKARAQLTPSVRWPVML